MAWGNSGPFLFGEIKHPEISGTTVGQSVLMRDASSAVQAGGEVELIASVESMFSQIHSAAHG